MLITLFDINTIDRTWSTVSRARLSPFVRFSTSLSVLRWAVKNNGFSQHMWSCFGKKKKKEKLFVYNSNYSCAVFHLWSLTHSLALSHAVTKMLTLVDCFWDTLWQTVGGKGGKLPTDITPPSGLIPARRGGWKPPGRHWARPVQVGCVVNHPVDDLHVGLETVETTGVVIRWVGKSIGMYFIGCTSATVSLASHLYAASTFRHSYVSHVQFIF